LMRTPKKKKTPRAKMTGSVASNLHQGSRSEYLAQYVFSLFGTAVPVPHQEDSGIDIYCTLLERIGQRSWPRSYFSVQVKSTMEPWVFEGAESVRWLIEHPLPIFLCVVDKSEARILVYHTTPRFALWALPHDNRLELVLGKKKKARTSGWPSDGRATLCAPVLNFTVQELLDETFHARVAEVLKFWIDFDVENLFRIKCGLPYFRVPYDYKTNSTSSGDLGGQMELGGPFTSGSLELAKGRLKELLSRVATHHSQENDMVSAAIYALTLRHLSPEGYIPGKFSIHPPTVHARLNEIFKMKPGSYAYAAGDLLQLVKDELAARGVSLSPPRESP
jgi:hypothetical protein